MSKRKSAIIWVLGAGGAAALALAGQVPQINFKLGLWVVKVQPQISGQMPMSDETLQKMSPEQRAKMEAMMQSVMAQMAKPRVYKECMTADKRAKGFSAGNESNPNCQSKVVTDTSTDLEVTHVCNGPDENSSTDMKFHVSGGDHMVGTVTGTMTRGGKTGSFTSNMEGQWLGSDCGPVKDIELQK